MPEDELTELRWPKDGDRLFVRSHPLSDATITKDRAERSYRLPIGYKRAGDILIEQGDLTVADRVNIIYPALFCYRQSMKLFLKGIIEQFADGQDFSPKYTHSLQVLWD